MSKLMRVSFKLLDLLVIFMMVFGSPMSAAAKTWTDPTDYPPGSEVTIQGDNSDGAAYQLGETVHVDVVGPNGYESYCDGTVLEPDVANQPGYYYWSCSVTLWSSLDAVGLYTYTANGLTSGVIEVGTFTDAPLDASVSLTNWETKGSGGWVTATLAQNNSNYKEGETVPFRIEMTNRNTPVSGNPWYAPICRDESISTNNGIVYGYTQLQPFNTSRNATPGGAIISTMGAFSGVGLEILQVFDTGATSGSLDNIPFDCGSTQQLVIVKFIAVGSTNRFLLWGGRLSKPGDTDPTNITFGHSSSFYPGGSLQMRLASPDKTGGINPGAIIQLARITVTKVVDSGPATPDQWCFTVVGPNSYNVTQCVPSGQSSVDFLGLDTGIYTPITESTVSGYAFVSGAGTNCTFSGSTATATVTAAAGGATSASCTFHNAIQEATLTLVKTVVNDDGGAATQDNFQAYINGSPVPWGVAQTLSAGTYTASEDVYAGYAAGAWDGDCAADGSVTLLPGDHKTCTITNDDQQAYITVVKVVNNDHGGTAAPDDFDLTLEGAATLSGVAVPVDPGTYTAGETLLPGYTFDGFSGDCDANGDVTVALGESKTCTLTNSDIQPKLTLVKTVVNDNGGTKVVADFSLFISGASATSGTAYGLNAGNYTASVTQQYGYTASVWGGDCAADGKVTLVVGDNKTCTITNNDLPGKIIIQKNAKLQNGTFTFTTTGTTSGPETSWPASFTLNGDPTNRANIKSFTVDAGTYTVTEGLQLGWFLTGVGGMPDPNAFSCIVTGSGGSTGVGDLDLFKANIDLKNGDTVRCVFENTGQGVTRTQGFWATHQRLANIAWFGESAFGHTFPGVSNTTGLDNLICGRPLDEIGKVMGGFWSDISKTSTGAKRSSLDQARMQLLQQLLAAELNASAFGSVPAGGMSKFTEWEKALCGTNTKAIQTVQKEAATFNSAGDSQLFTPGTSADSKYARSIANIPFWDKIVWP